MLRTVVIVSFALLCSLPASGLDDPTITVSSNAKISVRPNLVVLSASIESRAEQLSAAKDDNDKKIAAVIQFLQGSQIEAKDIQTDFIKIEPVSPRANKGYSSSFQSKPQQATRSDALKPIGYIVRRGFNIRIRNIKSFEKIYTGLIGKGINRVTGIEFQTTELAKLQTDARKKAIKAAKAKAELLAGELDAKLSGVQTIQDNTANVPRSRSGMGSMGMDPFGSGPSAPPLAVGEIEVTASVSVVFRLAETDFK